MTGRGNAFWIGVALVGAGVVLTFFGVRAGIASATRGDDLHRYARAASAARTVEKNGVPMVAAGKALLALTRSEVADGSKLRRYVLAWDFDGFDALNERIDSQLERKQTLLDRMRTYHDRISVAGASTG